MLILFPRERPTKFMFKLSIKCSNNEAQHVALVAGLEWLNEFKAKMRSFEDIHN